LKALTQEGVPGRDFGDGLGVDDVVSGRKSLSKRNLHIGGAGFEVEVLVAECGGAANSVDSDDDDREIEVLFGAIRNLDRAVDAVAVDQWRTKPVEQEGGGDQRAECFVDAVRRAAGIFDRDGESEGAGLCGTADQESFRSENNAFWKITVGDAPVIGWDASGGMQRDVDVDSGVEGGQIFVHDGERRWGLRGRETAQAERGDSQEPKGSGQDDPHFIPFPVGLILRRTQRKRTAR
jgi:hypothetical protein